MQNKCKYFTSMKVAIILDLTRLKLYSYLDVFICRSGPSLVMISTVMIIPVEWFEFELDVGGRVLVCVGTWNNNILIWRKKYTKIYRTYSFFGKNFRVSLFRLTATANLSLLVFFYKSVFLHTCAKCSELHNLMFGSIYC